MEVLETTNMNDKHLKKIIDKQFKICDLNIKFEDICDNQIPNWFSKFTCSPEQNEKWKDWTTKYMRDKMKLTKDKAFIETAWLDLQYGIKIKQAKKSNEQKKRK